MARILIVIFQIFRIRAQICKRREIRIIGKRVFERDVGKHSVFAMQIVQMHAVHKDAVLQFILFWDIVAIFQILPHKQAHCLQISRVMPDLHILVSCIHTVQIAPELHRASDCPKQRRNIHIVVVLGKCKSLLIQRKRIFVLILIIRNTPEHISRVEPIFSPLVAPHKRLFRLVELKSGKIPSRAFSACLITVGI